MAFGVGDELSVSIGAETADFERGVSRSQDSLDEFRDASVLAAAGLQALQSRADEAESEIDSVGRSATTSAAQVGAFGSASSLSAIGVNQLSGSIAVSLVPALATLSTILGPLIGALGGFVAVAGAIGATALLPTMGAIATRSEELQVVFGVLTDTIAEEFAPVFDVAAEVLFSLMGALTDVIPELVPAQDVVSQLAGNFAQLGHDIIDLLPAMVDLAVTLTQEFLPPFVTFAQNVLPQVPGMIRSLVRVFDRMLPKFMEAGRLIFRLLPAFTEFGFVALSVVGPALAEMARIGTDVLQFITSLDAEMQQLIAAVSVAAPIVLAFVSVLGGPVTAALAGVGLAVVGLAEAWRTNFAGIRDAVNGLWSDVQSILPQIRGAIDAFISGIDFSQLTDAVLAYEEALGTQLGETVEALGPVFDKFGDFLADNSEEFRLIGGLISDVVSGLIRAASVVLNVLGPAFRTFLIPVLSGFIDVLDLVLQGVGNAIEAFNELQEGDLQAAQAAFTEGLSVGDISAGLVGFGGQEVISGLQRVQVEVKVDQDGNVRAIAQDEASNAVNQEQRRTRERQGRGGSPT